MRTLALVLALATAAAAQPTLAVGGSVENHSAGYADGRVLAATLTMPRTGGWTRVDLGSLDRFGQQTLTAGLAAGRDIGEHWVLTGSIAGSSAGVIAPRVAGGVLASRRLTARKNVLLSVGGAARESRDGHVDVDAVAEVALYLDGAVIQLGGRLSQSRPGPAVGGGAFAAVSVGDPDGRLLIGRVGGAREAWTVLGDTRLDVSFPSFEASASWQEPVRGPWSAVASVGVYANPYYTRLGLRTGVVRRF